MAARWRLFRNQAMSRFDSLEFGERPNQRRPHQPSEPAGATGTPIRDADYFQGLADKEFREGRLTPALTNYSRALERDATRFRCWLGQVRILIDLGEYKEAALWADRALEMFPEHPELLAAKAVAALRMGLTAQGMAYSDNALSKKGVTPYVWLCRGETLLAQDSEMAEHCFAQALAYCSNREEQAWIRVRLARLLRRYHRFARALDEATEAIQVLPRDGRAWLELGLCQAELGLRDAPRSLRQALQLNPSCEEAERALTRHQFTGAGERVRKFFRRLLRH